MLINGDASKVLGFLMLSTLALLGRGGSSEGRMRLDIVNLAQSFGILIEFTDGFEAFNIDIIRFNGFTLSEVPNFLHFLLI